MPENPVVIIPPRSPLLEPVALAVLWGAADEGRMVPTPLIVGDAKESLPPALDAPLVFLGWRADLEESRRLATETFAALTVSLPQRRIATFEVSVRGSSSGETDRPVDSPHRARSTGPDGASAERFVLNPGSGGDSAGLIELARARRWAAETYLEWRSATSVPPSGGPREDATPTNPRTIAWCGMMD